MNNDIIENYITYKRNAGRSELTLNSLRYTLRLFQSQINKDLIECTKDDVVKFLIGYERKPSTKFEVMLRIKPFYNYLIKLGLVSINPCDGIIPKPGEQTPDPFNDDEINKIVNYIVTCKKITHKLLLSILLFTGVRISECINIKLKDIDFINKKISIVGKGHYSRVVLLTDELLYIITDYIKQKKITNPNQLLIKSSRQNAHEKFVRITDSLGIKHGHPHRMRHTFVTRLVDNTSNIHMVSALAGHTSILTTQRYTNISAKSRLKKLRSHPLHDLWGTA